MHSSRVIMQTNTQAFNHINLGKLSMLHSSLGTRSKPSIHSLSMHSIIQSMCKAHSSNLQGVHLLNSHMHSSSPSMLSMKAQQTF